MIGSVEGVMIVEKQDVQGRDEILVLLGERAPASIRTEVSFSRMIVVLELLQFCSADHSQRL